MDLFLFCLPRGGKDFSLIFIVEPWLSSWGKPHKILWLHYDWVSLELLILSCLHWASSNSSSFPILTLVLGMVSTYESLLQGTVILCIHLEVSPLLVWPVFFRLSSHVFQILKQLLIFQSAQLLTCCRDGVAGCKLLTWNQKMKTCSY